MKLFTRVNRQRCRSLIAGSTLLSGLVMMPLAMHSSAQQNDAAPIVVSGLHSFELRVSDVERSIEFYQGLFGSPVIIRMGNSVSLQIGDGPQHYTLAPTRGEEQPHISHFALSVPDFNLFDLQRRLSDHGIPRTVETLFDGRTPMRTAGYTWTVRLPDEGGDMMTDNHHLFLADRDAIMVQLSSPDACGAGEGIGVTCELEPAPGEGVITLREINHFTNYVANYQLTNEFYRRLFGLQDQAVQGNFPLLGLGDGRQFLMFVGGTQQGEPTQAGRIDHASLNIEDFTEESLLQRLADYGLSPRGQGQPAEPLQYWVSRRMPDRGGVAGGTAEVYFSDPDGIHIQLQHHTYCGGGGVFGEDCGL
jgi:catechol 2,3-dioxygenase-like lactoylglutathione lyase family enzyme